MQVMSIARQSHRKFGQGDPIIAMTARKVKRRNIKFHGIISMFQATILLAAVSLIPVVTVAADGPANVSLKKTNGRWTLMVDGKPYLIKGAGGGGSKQLLAESGGNSFRTWGVGAETAGELETAKQLGLTVTVGIWLGHKEHGFRYEDASAVKNQMEDVRKAVLKYKDHPALIVWSLGNEMEVDNETPEMWKAIQDLARMVHELDSRHPTMTVIAEIGNQGSKVRAIHQMCPDIDIIGINSYGGGPSLAKRYREAGGTKPYVVTEFGPPGTWEIGRTEFGAAPELTSTAKAAKYRETYQSAVLDAADLCLGSYAFTWGSKIEATSTWFGMMLPDGTRLAAVDTMRELWTGKPAPYPCPKIEKLELTSQDQVGMGETVTASATLVKSDTEPKIEWSLYREQSNYNVEGTGSAATASYPEAIEKNGQTNVTLKMPANGGLYRLYFVARDAHGGAANGSLPIKVNGKSKPTRYQPPTPTLPLTLVGEGSTALWSPSGYMGDHKSIRMDADCDEQPRPGHKSCLKVAFESGQGWGGVAWQHPANDWGDHPGGFDLSDAEKLTFWARGHDGGETVKFGFGMIDINKKYHDSGKAEVEIKLKKEWTKYEIDLTPFDLGCVKTGFHWSLGASGKPVTFYLSEVRYE